MAWTVKIPDSLRGHTAYFAGVKMLELELVYLIAVDLAGTTDKFLEGLELVISKKYSILDNLSNKIKSNKNEFEEMYKNVIRSLIRNTMY